MSNLLSIENLGLNYRLGEQTVTALRQVNLHVRKGEMVAILGPSGSGKSTLLYILGCLLRPTSGRFQFAGHEITQMNSEQLAALRSRTIGFVFQQFHLLPRAGVLENVLLASRYNREDIRPLVTVRQKAMDLIETVGLTSHLHHLPNQLSGGQQQRVAIARALINDPDLILADEPTGNLDSKSASQILDLLQSIHRDGHTVIIITHDQSVAARCDRVVRILDGVLTEVPVEMPVATNTAVGSQPMLDESALLEGPAVRAHPLEDWRGYGQTAIQNLMRNKTRSFLTMIGVLIGIAAVLSTITLGDFTRRKILESYEALGVNRLVIRAYPRWNVRAKDLKGPRFDGINQEHDVIPMRKLFTEIALVSPVVRDFVSSAQFGGQTDDQVSALGVNEEYFAITRRQVVTGHPFTRFHVQNHSPVCLIGHDIAIKLFGTVVPVGQSLQVQGQNEKQYSCLVMGVLASQTSNSEWFKPNEQILLPDTFLSIMSSQWNSKPYEMDLQMRFGASVDDLVTKIKQFLNLKYGRSAFVSVDADQVLVAQMRRFLSLFTMLLAGVAFISLAVGGVGITNMMLVSVTERFKEIGLRKALGARDREIRIQFLVESVILCGVAGLSGLVLGVAGYHTILYFATKMFPKIQFEWVFNIPAMLLSVICIVAVGLASGIVPALRAEKLEVVEALRSE